MKVLEQKLKNPFFQYNILNIKNITRINNQNMSFVKRVILTRGCMAGSFLTPTTISIGVLGLFVIPRQKYFVTFIKF